MKYLNGFVGASPKLTFCPNAFGSKSIGHKWVGDGFGRLVLPLMDLDRPGRATPLLPNTSVYGTHTHTKHTLERAKSLINFLCSFPKV